MGRLVVRMNVSLDGFVDHDRMTTGPALFRHWISAVRDVAGGFYGRHVYDLMRYWDEDRPEWSADQRDFAQAWRGQRKWVASRRLASVGPNATLVADDMAAAARHLKAEIDGAIAVSGPTLAQGLAEAGLVDAWQLYLHPVALGRGTPFFAGPRTGLRLVAHDPVGDGVIRLTYDAA
jgi:dihydrofolate reductase